MLLCENIQPQELLALIFPRLFAIFSDKWGVFGANVLKCAAKNPNIKVDSVSAGVFEKMHEMDAFFHQRTE